MITGITQVRLCVDDLNAAMRFYGEGLGLPIEHMGDHARALLPDGTYIRFAAGGVRGANPAGITHICLDTYDCDATLARALAYGARLSREDGAYDLGDLRIAFVYAPTGEEVEFWFVRHDGLEREPVRSGRYIKRLVHAALTLPDMQAGIDFYTALGAKYKTGWGWGCSLTLQDGRELELFTEGTYTRNESGYTHLGLLCDDAAATYAAALALGAQPHEDTFAQRNAFLGVAGEAVCLYQPK